MKRPAKSKKTKKKSSKVQSLVDETIADSESLEKEITRAISKKKRSKSTAKLKKRVASLSKAEKKKYARELKKTMKKNKKRIRSGAGMPGLTCVADVLIAGGIATAITGGLHHFGAI